MRWFDEYLESVAKQIRVKRIRQPLMLELEDHMLSQKDAYLDEGLSEGEAEKRTIANMGNALLVGGELDRVHRPKPQWTGVVLSLFFIALGLLLQQILSGGRMLVPGTNIIFAAASAVVLLLIGMTDYTFWLKLTFPALAAWLLLFLWRYHRMAAPVDSIMHLHNIIPWPVYAIIGRITPECISVAMPLLTAFLVCALRGRGNWAFAACIALPCLTAGLAGVYDSTGHSYNGMMLMALTGFAVMLIAVRRGFFKMHKGKSITAVLLLAIIPLADFLRKAAIDCVDNPELLAELAKVLSAARLLGRGAEIPGLSEGMALYPDVGENLLPLMIHRFGWIPFGLFTLGLISVLAVCFHRFIRMENGMGALLGLASTGTLAAQCALYYLFSFTDLRHYLCLPLISYGNAMLVIDAILVGVMLSVLRGQNLPEPARHRVSNPKSA